NIINERQHAKEGTLAENANATQLYAGAKVDPANIRITSGILRRRNYESSHDTAITVQKPSYRHAREYEDAFNGDYKRTIKAGRRRDRSSETRDNVGLILQPIDVSKLIQFLLFQKGAKHSSKTGYNDDYSGWSGNRFDTSKPFDLNAPKKKGKMTRETVSRQDYDEEKGGRYSVRRPQDSIIIQGDGIFTGESQTKAEFNLKKGERYEIARPQTSDLWKVLLILRSHFMIRN
uniref:SH3 domain-containing protein n=1 Tax=Elaeophora elaphi TaxID=1147741 RepID=A0A0R3RSH8_9BILA